VRGKRKTARQGASWKLRWVFRTCRFNTAFLPTVSKSYSWDIKARRQPTKPRRRWQSDTSETPTTTKSRISYRPNCSRPASWHGQLAVLRTRGGWLLDQTRPARQVERRRNRQEEDTEEGRCSECKQRDLVNLLCRNRKKTKKTWRDSARDQIVLPMTAIHT